jgi:hypothetical protein
MDHSWIKVKPFLKSGQEQATPAFLFGFKSFAQSGWATTTRTAIRKV